jgi:outer membrane immunogenic protein
MAADMPTKAPIMKAPPMPVYSWSGCYIDGGLGYGMWNQDHSTTTDFIIGVVDTPNITTAEVTNGGRGWLGRFGGGCDLQLSGTFSSFVIGAFGDYDTMDLKGSLIPQTIVANVISGDEKESSAWAVGGRIGYLIAPSIMSYVDAGWSETRFDQVNLQGSLGGATGTAFAQHTYNGWFLGSGFEYNFTWLPIQGLFLRTEYRYASYNRDNLTEFNLATGAPAGNAGLGNVLHAKPQTQTVTTSLVWRFNWFH